MRLDFSAFSGGTLTLTGPATTLADAVGTSATPFAITSTGPVPYTISGSMTQQYSILDVSPSTGSSYVSVGSLTSQNDVRFAWGTVSVAGNGETGSGGIGTLEFLTDISYPYISSYTIGNNGVLALSASGVVAGDVELDGSNSTIQTNEVVELAGVLSGTGGFTMLGNGTIILSEAESYTGFTVIGSGILALSGIGEIISSGGVEVEGTFDITEISTGGTSISNLSSTSTNGLVLIDGKILTVAQGTSNSYSGRIVGNSGVLVKTEAGSLGLDNANDFDGGTYLNDGSFLIGNNQALGTGPLTTTANTSITLNDGIAFDNNTVLGTGSTGIAVAEGNSATWLSNFSSHGGFTKNGLGSLDFRGVAVNAGPNVVAEGTFYNNGLILSDLVVNEGAVLAGTGSSSNTEVNGQLNPGNSPGTYTVTGNLVLGSTSNLVIQVDNNSNSVVNVLGDVTIEPGSVLSFQALPGYVRSNNQFDFLTGNLITGFFSQITTNSHLIQANLSYSGGHITVGLDLTDFSDIVVNNNNALAVGQALKQLADAGSSQGETILTSLIGLARTQDIQNALNQMQPALYKGLTITQENNAVKVQDTLGYRFQQELDEVYCYQPQASKTKKQGVVDCQKEKKDVSLWLDGFGDILRQSSASFAGSPQLGYQSKSGGVSLGLDGRFAECFYAGALGAYTDSSTHWTNDGSKGTIQTGYGGVYLSGISDMFYGNLSVIAGWSHYKGHRDINYSDVDLTATNTHGGTQLLSHADTGINLGYGGFTVRPFDSFDYITQTENSFTESGAGVYNLHVRKNNAIMLRNELGLQFAGCLCFDSSRWTISPKFSWVREVRIKGEGYTSEFAGTDVLFQSTGYFPDRSLFSPGVLVSGLMWEDRLALDLYYNGEFKHKYSDHNYGGQIRFGF
jgi:uncharacterized protein with beta-barrel porin domain